MLRSKAFSFQKKCFPSDPDGISGVSLRTGRTGSAICGRCPCMGAKCAEIPTCPWSQPSLGSFLWSRPEEEGRVKCWGSPRRLPGCFTVEKYFHCEVTHRRALRRVVFGVKGSCLGRGSVLTNCKKAFGNLFLFFPLLLLNYALFPYFAHGAVCCGQSSLLPFFKPLVVAVPAPIFLPTFSFSNRTRCFLRNGSLETLVLLCAAL